MATVVDATVTSLDAPRVLAGRFVVNGEAIDTPLGVVLPATDSQGGGAVRVILVNEATVPSSALADRALREWKQLAKVGTQKIVRIIDQGKLDDGKLYVASDVPAGTTLEDLVAKEGPLAVERIKSIVSQIGEALTEAQKVGVIHRDVSPRNVHVDGDKVTVGEFGLAEAVTDKVFGTPAFLSPEQAEGKPVDQRSNIYSLGAVIYYMLTGVPPFEGTPESLLAQHVSGTPPHPSAKRPTVPPELDRIVVKALEKSAGRRHLTLRQLITEIEAVSAASSVVRSEDLGSAATLPPESTSGTQRRSTSSTVIGLSVSLPQMIDEARTLQQAQLDKETPVFVDLAKEPVPAPRVERGDVPVFEGQNEPSDGVKTIMMAPVAPAETPKAEAKAVVEPSKPEMKPEPQKPVVAPVEPKAQEPVKDQRVVAKKPGFRETAWFKKGELDEELAKQASGNEDPLAPTGQTGKHVAVDPADLTEKDERRLSLKTGATQMMPAIKVSASGSAPVLPGERMDEEEMLAEMDAGRRLRMIAGVIAGVAIVGTILAYAITRAQPTAPQKSEVTHSAPPAGGPSVAPPAPAPVAAVPAALPPPAQPVVAPAEPPAPTKLAPAKHGKKRK